MHLEIGGYYTTVRGRIILLSSIALITFGIFNIATNSFAQEPEIPFPENLTKEEILNYIILKALAQLGPLVAGGVTIGLDYLRRRGIQISADAEKYLTESISSLVSEKSKWIYEQIRDDKAKWDKIDKEKHNITTPKLFPKSLGKQAKDDVVAHFTKMLTSNEFTGHAKKILKDNLPELVEAAVAKNNKELSERGRNLIRELGPLAIDSLLLLKDKDTAKNQANEIIKEAMKTIRKNFDFEEIQYDTNFAEMFVRAELSKKIGAVA